jgi:single-strand DNA-binding protein
VGVTKQYPPSEHKENTMNTVSLIGRLTADPETRVGESHESAAFRLAIARPGSETADFVDVVTFDALAKTVADHLVKGRLVAVTGRLRQSTWVTADGERRSKVGVVADGVIFLDAPKAKPADAADEETADRPAVGRYQKRKSA